MHRFFDQIRRFRRQFDRIFSILRSIIEENERFVHERKVDATYCCIVGNNDNQNALSTHFLTNLIHSCFNEYTSAIDVCKCIYINTAVLNGRNGGIISSHRSFPFSSLSVLRRTIEKSLLDSLTHTHD